MVNAESDKENLDSYDCRIEELGHTAEIGLRVQAPTAAQLFACAACGLFELICPAAEGTAELRRQLVVTAADPESLMVNWLNELLYLWETTGLLYGKCNVRGWSTTALEATIWGERPAARPEMHVKAVTYHQLSVRERATGWQAEIFFDI